MTAREFPYSPEEDGLFAVTVVSAAMVTPTMRRIVFHAPGIDLKPGGLAPYVKLFLPVAGEETIWPAWPRGSARPVWPADTNRAAMRTYSVRAYAPDRQELTIDFVLHDEAGPGTAWATCAQPGDKIRLHGPFATPLPPTARRIVLAGDETGLPAIAHMLDQLPAGLEGVALVEIAEPGHAIDLAHPGIEVRWLRRNREGADNGLADVVERIAAAGAGFDLVWAGAEAATARRIRRHACATLALAPECRPILNYWRRGRREGAFDYMS